MRFLWYFFSGVMVSILVSCAHMGPAPTHSSGRTWDDQGVSRPLSAEEGSLILQRTQDLDPSETPASWVPLVSTSAEPGAIPTGCKADDGGLAEYHSFFLGALMYYDVEMFHLVSPDGEVAVGQKDGIIFFCQVEDDRNMPHVVLPADPKHSLTLTFVQTFRDYPNVSEMHIPLQKGESLVRVYPWTREFLSLECVSACPNDSAPHVQVRRVSDQNGGSLTEDNDGP